MGPAEALPFADRSFDRALAQLVFHFVTDQAAAAREMMRVNAMEAQWPRACGISRAA